MQTNTAAVMPVADPPSLLRRLRLVDADCVFSVFQNGSTALFELRKKEIPIVAFRYSDIRQRQLDQRRLAFEKMFHVSKGDALPFPNHVGPVENGPIPLRLMWQPDVFSESGFWANPDLLISLPCLGNKLSAIAILWEGAVIGQIPLQGYASDSDEAIRMALRVKKDLRNPGKIRVEGKYNNKLVVNFI